MELNYQKKGDSVYFTISGKLDSNTSPSFESQIMPVIDKEKKLVFECEKLDYISSAGLRVFLSAAKKIKESGGKIALCSLKPQIKEVFKISGFSGVFPVYESPDELEKTVF